MKYLMKRKTVVVTIMNTLLVRYLVGKSPFFTCCFDHAVLYCHLGQQIQIVTFPS